MAEDDKLKYSDIIEPDDSFEKLVKQLEDINKSYETMVNAIRAGATKIVTAIKAASGATSEGRAKIDEAAAAASRLERAERELAFSISSVGQQVAWLKAQTADNNRATVEQQRYAAAAATSYNKLKLELKDNVALYKSLTDAERQDVDMGGQVLATILNLKGQIAALDEQMKLHIQTMTLEEKAQKKLAYLTSESGQRYLELKAKIAELTEARRTKVSIAEKEAQVLAKLAAVENGEYDNLKLYTTQLHEANRIKELTIQINNSEEGSYNRLSAQYSLNKIKLNQMGEADEQAAAAKRKLEEETKALYEQMIKLQEATGKHTLSVGNYKKAWNGLGMSVNQIVREIPAAAISINTFFLGISNNVPILIDEIQKLKRVNEELIRQGKPTKNVIKEVVRSLFSWNTALVALLTVFAMYGEQIIEWIRTTFKGTRAAMTFKERIAALTKEIKENSSGYGDNIVTLKKLSSQWNELTSHKERIQWIKDNTSEFNKLGIAVNSVSDAEVAFVNGTPDLIRALQLRAKATAAQSLAADKYTEAFTKRAEAAKKEVGDSDFLEVTQDYFKAVREGFAGPNSDLSLATRMSQTAGAARKENIKALQDEASVLEQEGDAFFELADGYSTAADELLKALGLFGKARAEHTREPRDLTKLINQNEINIQKKYEESVTKLRHDEFAKRRKEAEDQVQNENAKLRELYRLNEEYVANAEGKYKQLTESQKEQIAQQQKWIKDTIANNLKLLALQLEQIQNEQLVNAVKLYREAQNAASGAANIGSTETTVTTSIAITRDASEMEASLVQERKLLEKNLDLELQLTLETNKKLLEAGDNQARSEEEILIEFNKKRLQLWSEYDQKILETRETDIQYQLDAVKKGSEEEYKLLLQQLEVQRQLELAKNAAKPAEQQVSTDAINAKYKKAKSNTIVDRLNTEFDQRQALLKAEFDAVKHNQQQIMRFELEQEKLRWERQIALAEEGAIDWSQAQIDAAKATVKGINSQLKEVNSFIARTAERGLGGALLEAMGFNEDQIGALSEAANTVIDQFGAILEAEVELAEKEKELADERVDNAKSALDAEIEARNNGYANNVDTAKKNLALERKNQAEKQKILEQAQRRQQNLDTVLQASSLITASANLWKSFSSIPIVGPALALAAIATMWTSFALAKIKAKQVTAASAEQAYGEGGIEFLEGGSHASGNDIDLHTKNKKGRNMRAEGGETLAIINKRNTAKYRKVLPSVIDSLNKGVFEDKFMASLNDANNTIIMGNAMAEQKVDLSFIEDVLQAIKKQGDTKVIARADGAILEVNNNVVRVIKFN